MKNKMFSGWSDVFCFTLKQSLSQRYKIITLVLAIILFAAGFCFNFFAASNQAKSEDVSEIEKVYLIDQSEIANLNWNDSKQFDREQFPNIIFENSTEAVETLGLQLNENEASSVIAEVIKAKDSFRITVYIPNGSAVSNDDAKSLAKAMEDILYEGIIVASEIDSSIISYVVSSGDVEFATVGENAKSDELRLLTTVFPMVLMFMLYFMVLIYGQTMGQIVSVEKSSKLMETLLVMTRPYGLIFGKIIATSVAAIMQIALWIVAAVAGFVLGDSYAKSAVYAEYDNYVLSLFSRLSADEYTKAFSGQAIALTIIALCLAFLFYCMLAGAIASFASKAEELNSVMMFFNLFMVFGFIGSYIIPAASGQEWIKVVIRLIPVSAAFLLPGEILVGTVSTETGILYILVLAAWIVATAVFAGKVYKDQVFYRGKSLKDRLPWLKKNSDENEQEEWQYLHDEVGSPLEGSQKVGYFFLALTPLVIFFIIQIFASLVLTNVMTRVDLKGIDLANWEIKDFVDYYNSIESVLNPMTMMVNHILIILIFGLWMYFIRRGINRENVIHIKTLLSSKVWVILGVCIVCGVSLCFFANGVVVLEAKLTPSLVENYMELAEISGLGKNIFAIISAVCLAPIGEEFLCRGVCLHFGKRAFGNFWYANILQAVLFGVLHMNWVQGVYAFFIGLALGVLVERYDSILPAMIVHFIVNFSSSTWVPKLFENINTTLVSGIILLLVPGAIAVATLCFTGNRGRS